MRLAFSVAINVDAEILLIDEILAVGDQHFQEKCFAKLKELRDSGKTIVIVSHSLDTVKKLCRRAVWIYKGEIRLDGDPTYVINQYLKQVAIDHKEEVKKAIEKGTHRATGIITIDTPKDFSDIALQNDEFICSGWEISNSLDTEIEIFVDDKKIDNIDRHLRKDVYDIYKENYAGFLDVESIGWRFSLKSSDLPKGKHKIVVKTLTSNGQSLASNDVEFTII